MINIVKRNIENVDQNKKYKLLYNPPLATKWAYFGDKQ